MALQYSGQHGHCGAAVVWPVGVFFKDTGTADVIARQLVQLGLSSFACRTLGLAGLGNSLGGRPCMLMCGCPSVVYCPLHLKWSCMTAGGAGTTGGGVSCFAKGGLLTLPFGSSVDLQLCMHCAAMGLCCGLVVLDAFHPAVCFYAAAAISARFPA